MHVEPEKTQNKQSPSTTQHFPKESDKPTPVPLHFLFHSFIEVSFTYHTAHSFTVYNAVVFIHAELCNQHYNQF